MTKESATDHPSADAEQAALHVAWLAAHNSGEAPAPGAAASSPGRLPAAVAALGYGGLIPFLAFAAGASQGELHADLWRAALYSYGAVILSFVGALHWGFAMAAPGLDARQRTHLYVWSVVPALLAWPALLVYVRPAMVLLIGGFAAQLAQDYRLVRQVGSRSFLPAWYLPLRLNLSLVAAVCLAVGGLWHARQGG